MIKIHLLPILLGIAFVSCKGKEISKTTSAQAEKKETFSKSLIIEFYSRGAGINHTAYSTVKSFLESPTKGISCEFENQLIKYGREGERQYCMTFTDENCYKEIHKIIREKIGTEKNTRIKENSVCRIVTQ